MKRVWLFALSTALPPLLGLPVSILGAEFEARPLTPEGSFTGGIEGPACDAQGNIFAVNFQREGTIGRVTPEGKAELFVELPAGSVGNGIRFDRQGMMYVLDFGMDGMRCDVDGNLYITRHGKGTVAKVSPQGRLLREIDVLGKMPSNICFGGRDGCTAYVTEMEHRRLVEFRVDRPGLSWRAFGAE
jgi:sugar lactone lactonase YvrE